MPTLSNSITATALLALGDELGRAATPADVVAAVVRRLPALTAAPTVALFARSTADDGVRFEPLADDASDGFTAAWSMGSPALVQRAAIATAASAYRDLYRVLPPSVVTVAVLPVGADYMLVLGWPQPTALGEDDWRLIESLARQAGSALERTDAVRRVRELSLEDPETGLGNRRLVEIVLQHSFALAARGEPLSVVSIRPALGSNAHQTRNHAGLASALRLQARGSDVVAHFSDGVYVVILHAATAEGAGIFLRRVLADMHEADVSVVVAEHDGRFESPAAMLDDVLARAGASPFLH